MQRLLRQLLWTLSGVVLTCLILSFTFLAFKIMACFWTWARGQSVSSANRVAILEVSGVLWSAQSTLKRLEEVGKDKSIRALVIRINSPGGLVVPSHELYGGIRKLDEKIPVLISMGTVAASGGYYGALAGRQIFANPASITGSIGVIMEFVNTQKLYQWAKLERFSLKTGKFKDMGSPLREMTAEEKQILSGIAQNILSEFKRLVGLRRHLTAAEVDAVSDGRIFTGKQALDAKLVDGLGTLDDVVEEAKKAAGLPTDAPVEYLKKRKSFLHNLVDSEDDFGESRLADSILTLLGDGRPAGSLGWQPLLLSPYY